MKKAFSVWLLSTSFLGLGLGAWLLLEEGIDVEIEAPATTVESVAPEHRYVSMHIDEPSIVPNIPEAPTDGVYFTVPPSDGALEDVPADVRLR